MIHVPLTQGCRGGENAKLQAGTGHPSSLNVDYGACYGNGIDANGEAICNLASYSKMESTTGAESVRHMGPEIAGASRHVYAVLKGAGLLSKETLAHGGFTACQVRVYDGSISKCETKLHTDTVVGVDSEGNPRIEIDHVEGTDVAIYTVGATMLLWRKTYPATPKCKKFPWLHPTVPLSDGSLFVWKTGLTKKGKKRTKKGKKETLEKSDDWK